MVILIDKGTRCGIIGGAGQRIKYCWEGKELLRNEDY